jgi:hypothetical protein
MMLRVVLLLCTCPFSCAESACTAKAPLSIDLRKLRVAAKSLGFNASVSGLPTVDTIDRQLTVVFDLPELNLTAGAPSFFNETCGRSWSCGCLRYEVCPGMELTAAMARDFATVADTKANPPMLTVSPASRHLRREFEQTHTVCYNYFVRAGALL